MPILIYDVEITPCESRVVFQEPNKEESKSEGRARRTGMTGGSVAILSARWRCGARILIGSCKEPIATMEG